MNINVFYSAQLSMVTGCDRETVNLSEPCTVAECLDGLVERHGDALGRLVQDEAGVRRSLVVCVNNQHIYEHAGAQLSEGDELVLLTAISGG